jgi:hypothetical protein
LRNQIEHQNQVALMQWCKLNETRFPALKWIFHIPNGGSRNVIEAANLKRAGVKAGIPDLFLPVARKMEHGLFIEMKAGKNTLTKNQEEFLDHCFTEDYKYVVCYSWQNAVKYIEEYLS